MNARPSLLAALPLTALLLLATPAAAEDETDSAACTTTDYSFQDPGLATGPYYAVSGTPPTYLGAALIVNLGGSPVGNLYVSVYFAAEMGRCIPA